MSDEVDDFLAHYGVLGMKWGVRKDRKRASNYSQQQERRDKQVYGRRGASRINKKLKRGDMISVARGDEKTRKDRVVSKNKYVRQAGKIGGTVAGVAVANLAINQLKKAPRNPKVLAFLSKILTVTKAPAGVQRAVQSGIYGAAKLGDILSTPQGRIAVSAGAASIGNMMAGDVAVNTRMRLHGYDPNRK